MVANAGEDIENMALIGLGILRALRGQQRQLQAACQIDGGLIACFLLTVVVALQFDINIIVTVDRDELFERAATRRQAAAGQCISQQAFIASRETDQPDRILVEIGHRSCCLRMQDGIFRGPYAARQGGRILWRAQLHARYQAAEILVALARSAEQR